MQIKAGFLLLLKHYVQDLLDSDFYFYCLFTGSLQMKKVNTILAKQNYCDLPQLLVVVLLFQWCFLAHLCKTGFESIEDRTFVIIDICTQIVSMFCICGNVEGSLLTCWYLASSPTSLSHLNSSVQFTVLWALWNFAVSFAEINLSQSKACDFSAAVVVLEECRSATAGEKVSFLTSKRAKAHSDWHFCSQPLPVLKKKKIINAPNIVLLRLCQQLCGTGSQE